MSNIEYKKTIDIIKYINVYTVEFQKLNQTLIENIENITESIYIKSFSDYMFNIR